MTITFESAHKRYRDAREEYLKLDSLLAIARAKMNAAERECSVEWQKVVEKASSVSRPTQNSEAK